VDADIFDLVLKNRARAGSLGSYSQMELIMSYNIMNIRNLFASRSIVIAAMAPGLPAPGRFLDLRP
jgi:hypothetical protein